MLEEKIDALTAAIIKLTQALSETYPNPVADEPKPEPEQAPVEKKTRRKPVDTVPEVKAEVVTVNEPAPEPLPQTIRREDLQELAMQIVRADPNEKTSIKSILAEHNAVSITRLEDSDLREVHGKLLALAHKIAKEGEQV